VKDKWYGDNNDLVKWSVLLHLADRYKVGRILQVLYYRQDTIELVIEIDDREHQMPEAVKRHFRDAMDIIRLKVSPNIKVEVIGSQFNNRDAYLKEILARILATKSDEPPCIVFLDPDTGLAPGKPKWEHVLKTELEDIWGAMRSGDVLVFYQHKGRQKGPQWFEPRLKDFRDALRITDGAARTAQGGKGKKKFPVVFFFAQKDGSPVVHTLPCLHASQAPMKSHT
jgi:hypothetical protein